MNVGMNVCVFVCFFGFLDFWIFGFLDFWIFGFFACVYIEVDVLRAYTLKLMFCVRIH